MSNNFDVDDIHKIRYENYEKTKHLSDKELIAKTEKNAKSVIARIEEIRRKKKDLNTFYKNDEIDSTMVIAENDDEYNGKS